MSSPTTISTGGVVVVTDPTTIINGITPSSLSWSNSSTAFYIYNSTGSPIPLKQGFSYYDSNSVINFSIPALTHIQIVLWTDGTWHDQSGDTPTPDPFLPYVLPIASVSKLGGVRGGGSNIVIDGDGTINAVNGSQVQTDWNETNPLLPDYLKNKPTFLQVQTDWNEADNTQPDYLKNKPTIPAPYVLPAATPSVRGGIKVGSGLVITGDVLSAPVSSGGITQLTGDISAGPGTGSQAATLASIVSPGTVGDSTHVPQITVDPKGRVTVLTPIAIAGVSPTCMPKASEVGVLANGTDQTANLISALSNPNYSGIVFDFSPAAPVVINGSVNCGAKVLRFQPGNIITGTFTIINYILDCGLRQYCFDIGSSGHPVGITNPIGTTNSVISPWVFGAKGDGTDDARPFQATIDCVIRNPGIITKIIVPSSRYKIGSPLIAYSWDGSKYVFHMGIMEGENTFSSADGTGTQLDFSSRKNSFGIGIHQGKGWQIKNIKLIGGFNYTFPGAYAFYNLSYAAMTDGVSRDSTFSPNSGIAIDPFGPSVPADGGYPGNDAYGTALSTYYRGNGNGSTGTILEDIFIATFVVGIIHSPNGQTANAELTDGWKIQFQNVKNCIASCQSQEKLNTFRHLQVWGVSYYVFSTGLYGAASPGSYWVNKVNLAGLNNSFIYNSQTGYFPSFFSDVYAESLGRMGLLSGDNGTTFMNSTLNFAYYDGGGAFSYLDGQITGEGFTFIGCQIRIFGTFKPVTINALNGPIYFRDCGFETVPFFNQDYTVGYCSFSNCNVAGTGFQLNPLDMQTVSILSATFAYGNIKVKVGSPTTIGRIYNIKNSVPAIRMPINRTTANYLVTVAVIGSFNYATITCAADELNRVFVGDVICGEPTGNGVGIRVLGIVDTVTPGSPGTFRIAYLPAWVVSGNHYYLYVWLQLKNISFIGDTTSGSNIITNVSIVDGSITDFVAVTGIFGGLLMTRSFQQTDAWNYGMIRLAAWNGSNQITVDRNATASVTKLLFTNTDATLDPGTPTIVAGAASGTGPTLSIIKGNDKSMQVRVITGIGPSTGTLATITFSFPFAGGLIPCISFSPANGAAAALSGATQVFMDTSRSDSFIISTGSSALGAGITYLWNIDCS